MSKGDECFISKKVDFELRKSLFYLGINKKTRSLLRGTCYGALFVKKKNCKNKTDLDMAIKIWNDMTNTKKG